ncbi:MAG: SMP-30/gluconolactonase/LRE family protein [Motilibacteraceae bacterium]
MASSVTSEVLREGLAFGEGPRWHQGRLWFSDFYRHAVFTLDLDGREQKVLDVPQQPSGLGWLPDGRLLVVSMLDRRVLRLEPDGSLVQHADLSDVADFHANDMLVDGEGRAYVGNFGFDLHAALAQRPDAEVIADESAGLTRLALVQPDGTVSVAADEVRFPNGMVLLDGGRTLVVAETLRLQLTAFDVAADGSLSNRRVWASTAAAGVAPDGICTDGDVVWAAAALKPAVVGFREGGEVAGTVTTSQYAYACALGGEDGRTLFAMTAPSSEPRHVAAGGRGKVEVARV